MKIDTMERMSREEGKIIVYYGAGEGKTVASIGHVIRALGHKKEVVILQFMKGRATGEYRFIKKLANSYPELNLQIHLCGAPEFLDERTRELHQKKANEGLELAHRVLREVQPDLLVLDEILYAIKFGLLTEEEVVELLKRRGHTDIILSGRGLGARIAEMADIVTHMEKVKHYWDNTGETTSGIEY